MCKIQHCHCMCLQETHQPTTISRPNIDGLTLIVEHLHKYGSAILIQEELKVEDVYERVYETVGPRGTARARFDCNSLLHNIYQLSPCPQRCGPDSVLWQASCRSLPDSWLYSLQKRMISDSPPSRYRERMGNQQQ